jgi:N-acetylmuramoyl-L-alanine amidase
LARLRAGFLIALAVASSAVLTAGRQGAGTHAALPFVVVSPDARRPLAATQAGEHTMVALDDLAALFQLNVREDAMAGGVTVGYKGKTVILTPGQALTSAAGRLVSLPAPPARDGRRWLVPVEFISRALALVYDAKLDVRKNARLVLVGDVRVPHIAVRQESLGPQTRVTFNIAPRTPHNVAQDGTRILVKFDADALDVSLPPASPGQLVQAIRLGDANNTIAIDLGPRFGSFRTSVVPQDDGTQVLVDVMPPAEGLPVVPPRGGAPAPAPAPQPPAEPAPTGPAAGTLRTVVIDPGHGGEEVGAKGGSGVLEKDLTLAIARRLKAHIESRLGVRVLLTRDGDQAVALDERAALANNNKADVFLSLHGNASFRKDVSGAQVYSMAAVQPGDGVSAPAGGRQTLPALGGGSREVEMIPWDLAQLAHVRESGLLAGALEEQLRGRVRMNARPVLQAPVRVLAGANMPAVLIEIGFLTNPDEEQQLVSDAYQATFAQAVIDGLLRFRELADAARTAPVPALPAPPERRRP